MSATRTSPARPGAGPATPTRARRRRDALGSTAYYDNASNTAETITGCHRSKAAEVIIGGGVNCEEPRLLGGQDRDVHRLGGDFKPGLDFYYNGSASQGQARMLQDFAAANNVKMVTLSIGGNDFNFAVDRADLRHELPDVAVVVEELLQRRLVGDVELHVVQRRRAKTTAIKNAILNVSTAMTNAGYSTSQYTIVVQDYLSPMPTSSGLPLLARPATRARAPAAAASGTTTPTGPTTRRCRRSTTPSRTAPPQTGPQQREDPGAAVDVQRPAAVREHGRAARGEGPRHLAERGRRRQERVDRADPHAVDGVRRRTTCRSRCTPTTGVRRRCATACGRRTTAGTPRGGTCTRTANGLNANGEPNMTLQ